MDAKFNGFRFFWLRGKIWTPVIRKFVTLSRPKEIYPNTWPLSWMVMADGLKVRGWPERQAIDLPATWFGIS